MNIFNVHPKDKLVLIHLNKGDDMLDCIIKAIEKYNIKNGVIVSLIGTLDKACFHMIQTTKDIPTNKFYSVQGPIEVTSGQGLIINGEPHIHVSFASPEHAYMGHLEKGCRVLYLAEIAIQELSDDNLIRKSNNYGIEYLTIQE